MPLLQVVLFDKGIPAIQESLFLVSVDVVNVDNGIITTCKEKLIFRSLVVETHWLDDIWRKDSRF